MRTIHTDIAQGRLPQGYELRESDVGVLMSVRDGFGLVLKIDVGKRVWVTSHGFTMENNEQRDRRKR
jgi:hypothetical protein